MRVARPELERKEREISDFTKREKERKKKERRRAKESSSISKEHKPGFHLFLAISWCLR